MRLRPTRAPGSGGPTTRIPWALLAGAAALLACLTACPKTPGPPSPEFDKANTMYVALLAKDGPTEVFGDAQIPDVLALLGQVPATSVDAAAAKQLSDTINAGKKDYDANAEEKAKALAAANAPPTGLDLSTPQPASPPTKGTVAAPAAPGPGVDAGPPLGPGPTVGMKVDEFNLKYGSCFSRTASWDDSSGNAGDTFTLSSDPACAQKYPAYASQAVLMGKDKVMRVVDKGALGQADTLTIKNEQTTQRQVTTQTGGPTGPAAPPALPPGPTPIGTTPSQLPEPDDLTKTNLQPVTQ